MQKLYILLLGFVLVGCTGKQIPEGAIELPKKLRETSGLALENSHFLTFNDSGGKPTLYAFNLEGEIVNKHKIKGAVNRDWEDIAQDSAYYYIADTGNNFATRKDLTIYRVSKEFKLIDSIGIRYAAQKKFKFKKKNEFDAETLISYNDTLLLFSKDRKYKKTKLYVIPKISGEYTLESIATFEVNALITGGDYDAKNKRVALTGYRSDYSQHFFILNQFQLENTEQIELKHYQLPYKNAQVEAVVFDSKGEIWISSEGEDVHRPFLDKIDLSALQPVED